MQSIDENCYLSNTIIVMEYIRLHCLFRLFYIRKIVLYLMKMNISLKLQYIPHSNLLFYFVHCITVVGQFAV